MQLPSYVVDRGFGSAIRQPGKVDVFHVGNTADGGRNHQELGRCLQLEQRPRGLEQHHGSHRVDTEMVLELADGRLGPWTPIFGDTRVGNDDVEFLDAVAGL